MRPRFGWTFALLAASAISAGASDFRGVDWGASKAEVREIERHPMHHDIEGEIAYWNFELAGVEAGLVYEFEEGKLVRARYVSRHRTTDPAEDLADYLTWQKQFTEHFGEPNEEAWEASDGGEVGEASRTLQALAAGEAVWATRWTLDTSSVTLLIAGGDGEIKTVRAVFEPRR